MPYVRQPLPGSALIVLGCALWLSLVAMRTIWVPITAKSYRPKEPPVMPLVFTGEQLALGSQMPGSVRNAIEARGPYNIVAYASCPTCSLLEIDRAKRLAGNPDITLLVLTPDRDFFNKIMRKGGARIVFADASLVQDLRLSFSPRLYVYDENGILVSLQAENENLENILGYQKQ